MTIEERVQNVQTSNGGIMELIGLIFPIIFIIIMGFIMLYVTSDRK